MKSVLFDSPSIVYDFIVRDKNDIKATISWRQKIFTRNYSS